MVEPIQMIMQLPIFKVKYPSISLIVFSNFVPLVNFDLLGELEFFKEFLIYLSARFSIKEATKRNLQEEIIEDD